jgi:hypothetical protein
MKPIPKGSIVDGDMTAALDGRFLNAMILRAALEKRKSAFLPVTIDRVEFHEFLKYENGQIDKNAYLLYFVGSDKPLKLAKTNIKRIINQYGAMGKEWHGKKINLTIEQDRRPDLKTKGDCVRVMLSGRPAPAFVLPTADETPEAIETQTVEHELE